MPRRIRCRICGALSPRYGFAKRMSWLRKHRKRMHYAVFRASIKRGIQTIE